MRIGVVAAVLVAVVVSCWAGFADAAPAKKRAAPKKVTAPVKKKAAPKKAAVPAKSRVCVVEEILPVMKEPGVPYKRVKGDGGDDLYLEGDGIEAVVVYGNHLTVSPIEGRHSAGWVRLEVEGTPGGYVEKKGLEPLPGYTPLKGVFFQAAKDEPQLLLQPGAKPGKAKDVRYDLADRGYFLLKGEVVPGFGEFVKDGEKWILLGFDTADNGEGGAGGRFAWCRANDLTNLSTYEPDTSKIDSARVPTRFRDSVLPDIGREEIPAKGFWIDPGSLIPDYVSVDDMSDLYQATGLDTPDFVTTDLYFHAYHVVFDRMLQHLEAAYFAPALRELLTAALDRLTAASGTMAPAMAEPDVAEGYALVRDVLALSLTLLDEPASADALSAAARTEYGRIMTAEGREKSAITLGQEDYTQYRPRGHYTLSPGLERYFRAMSFLGSAHLSLLAPVSKDATPTGEVPADTEAKPEAPDVASVEPSSADQAAMDPAPEDSVQPAEADRSPANAVAAAIFCTLWDDPAVAPLWRRFQDPLVYMMGRPDDNGPDEMAPTVRGILSGDLSLTGDAGVRERLLSDLLRAAAAPRITDKETGPILWTGEEKKAAAMGFRLIGKRFVFDAYVFDSLTDPSVLGRTKPDAADVMAVLGSKAAGEVTAPYREIPDYAQNMEELKKELPAFFESPEARTSISAWLRVLSDSFADSGSTQFFYGNGAWQWKKLATGAASWAEMKHDTVLYAKQSGAEMGEGGDWIAGEFAPPRPRGYVEPDPQAFGRMAEALDFLSGLYGKYDMDDGGYADKIRTLSELSGRARDIAAREVSGDVLSPEDYRTVKELARSIDGWLLLPAGVADAYDMDRDQLKMAVVTDVATDFFNGEALHVATGTPRRIYVYVDDRSGGARVAVGYVYSYYEFPRPLADGRMTDEEWKKIVYDPDKAEELEKLHPAWYENLR